VTIHYAYCYHRRDLTKDDEHVTLEIEATTCPECLAQIDDAFNGRSFDPDCKHKNRYTNMASGAVFCRDCDVRI
jgi:hypothetical protein